MNPLDETISWYRVVQANQLLVAHVLSSAPEVVPDVSPFSTLSNAEATRQLERAGSEIDDLTVLALVSFFEQLLLAYVRELAEQITAEQTEPVPGVLAEYAFKNAERWRFKEILKLSGSVADASVLERVEKLYDYRNWVAHGKHKLKPVTTDPLDAYAALSLLLRQIGYGSSPS